ncbi:hypothetical protein [Herpetosiphon llansteffanensis]|uniref:hypothetical protein n=1 Tax=Herpetosiphon llansteffanensis TaxID=2094568 RepID=UPI000D7C9CCD|nr:hypothetical protein [Herpetosiphon llansteffanensis]
MHHLLQVRTLGLLGLLALLLVTAVQPSQAQQPLSPKIRPEPSLSNREPLRSQAPQGGNEWLVPCAASAENWQSTVRDDTPALNCEIYVPESAMIFVMATGSFSMQTNAVTNTYEGRIGLTLDGVLRESSNRWGNVYALGQLNTGETSIFASTTVFTASAGVHTLSLVGGFVGYGPLTLNNAQLTVLAFPTNSANIQVCATDTGLGVWRATPTSSVVRACSFNLPSNSTVFVSADGSALPIPGNEVALQFRLGVDEATTGDVRTDRYVDVDSLEPNNEQIDGNDISTSIAATFNLTAGNHTINFLGNGSGSDQAYLSRSSLVVLAFPSGSNFRTCTSMNDSSSFVSNGEFGSWANCLLTTAGLTRGIVVGNVTVGQQNGEPQVRTRLRANTNVLLGSTRTSDLTLFRMVGGQGDDKTMTSVGMSDFASGLNVFNFDGYPTNSSTVRMIDPNIHVLAFPDPFMYKQYTPLTTGE